jgi:hypothetical protein
MARLSPAVKRGFSSHRRLQAAEEQGHLWKSAGAAWPRGVSVLSLENEKNIARRGKSEPASGPRSGKEKQSSKKKGSGSAEVGNALRTVYQRTVNEDIPPDLLDLLGKLG